MNLAPHRDKHEGNAEQLRFRLDHKRLCFQRAIDRGDYHAANIFAAQVQYLETKLVLNREEGRWFVETQ